MKGSDIKTLIVVRHSKALQGNYSMEDIDRPLTDRGYSDAYQMSKQLLNQKIKPDLVISSPAVRAISTAFIFARQLYYLENELKIESKIYAASVSDIDTIVGSIDDKVNTAIIFGHNPSFENYINSISKNKIEHLPTTGICIIVSSAKKWSDLNYSNCKIRDSISPELNK